MKICVIGDPHFANRKLFAKAEGNEGINSRLRITQQTLETIADNLEDDIRHVVILGDLTHEHGRLTPPVLYSVSRALSTLANNDRMVSNLIGNHDRDANGQSIISAFDERDANGDDMIESLEAGRLFWENDGAEDWVVYGISYMSHDETLHQLALMEREHGDKNIVLCMHHHFDGAVHGAHEFQPPGGLNPKDIPDCVKVVLCGHYHLRQSIGKRIQYIGTPLQHDFGEAGNAPGYTVLTIEDDKPYKLEFRDLPSSVCPRYHILPYSLELEDLDDPADLGLGDIEWDYYRIDVPADADLTHARELAKRIKNCKIKVVPVAMELRSRVEEHLAEQGKAGGKVELNDVIQTYAEANVDTLERAQDLTELGIEIANTVIGADDD